MKKITLALIAVLLFGVKTIKAQEQELTDTEPISSGCLSLSRSVGGETPSLPTIILTKEGSILSVDILNYESTCSTTGFDMKSRMSGNNDDTPSVFISVVPVIPFEADCICTYNVSYTIRDFEKNKFFLTCWWYDGLVELTEGEPLVLEYKEQVAVIDGLKYRLLKTSHQAKLLNADSWDNETEILQIPSEVEYEGEQYTVSSINLTLFNSNNTITKIIIPKTVKNSEFGGMDGITWNPFSDCLSLETIEVDKDNPAMFSIDGVLFNKDKTTIISYPAASPRESYSVPNGVTTMTGHAFINNQHLKKIVLPLSMETLEVRSFANSKSLEEINIPSKVKILPGHLFEDCIKLKSVLIPDGVDNIGAYAFEGCSSLESISIPESVSTIGVGTFKGCTSLKSVFLSPNLKVIPYEMFADCSNLTEFMIPFGITSIGYDAFAGCTAMQSVDLPSSINFIGSYAFRNISNLKDFYCHATAVPTAYYEIFSDTDLSQATLHVPAASVGAYQAVEPWKSFKEIVALPAQNDFYYHQGNKIPLTLNENKVVVSIPKDRGDIIERVKANIQTLGIIRDTTFDINVVQRSEYDKLTTLEFWTEDAKSVILTSSYFTENNEEVYATPYLNIELKKEEDIDLLASYAEQYKLIVVGNSALMPLWYILHVTPDSEKNSLVCANELYESGNFAASVPDLASGYSPQTAYRPFVEDGKVWKVGGRFSGNPVQVVEYYYFNGDTIIDGKTCKQMMCQRFVSPDYPEYKVSPNIFPDYVGVGAGAWYEEDKKVYKYDSTSKQFTMMYDFSLEDNGTFQIDGLPLTYVVGPRQTGGIKGFKGVYRDVGVYGIDYSHITWMEGVGGTDRPTKNVYSGFESYAVPLWGLMSCAVGDEVIYLNDEYEDGTTPDVMNAQKHRFDFTHTTKERPKAPRKREKSDAGISSSEREVVRPEVKAPRKREKSDACISSSEREVVRPEVKVPMRRGAEQSIYGEYNELQLGINLEPIDDSYLVRITDASGNAVYEKAINAGNIVGLNIDISTYAKGRYTVTVENSIESFTGEFEIQTTGIEENVNIEKLKNGSIFNLQGQRLNALQKGLNIVNGQKVFVR